MDQVLDIVVASHPVIVGTTPPPPQFPDIDTARMWTSKEVIAFVSATDQARTIRLQYLRLHQMRCAAPTVTARLTELRAYVAMGKPPLVLHTIGPQPARGKAGYSWFGPFTVLTDGVSVQEKRLRLAPEVSCDATFEMLEAIRAKREKRQTCIKSTVAAAIGSPSGLAAYAACDSPFSNQSLPGCVFADGSGSGCEGDPERTTLPYLLSPKEKEWSRGGEEKLSAIDATLTGVSVLTSALDATESRYASSDGAAQAAIASSVTNLQAAFNPERTLLDAEKARLAQERRDLDVLVAEIARQRHSVTRYTSDKAHAERTVRNSQLELNAEEARLSKAQEEVSKALLKAENAFINDQSKGRNCQSSGSDCALAIKADFNRSNASVDAFRNGQIALREFNTARLIVVKLTTAVMADRLALVKVSTQLAQTQTLLAFNEDRNAKRMERMQQDQRHLDKAVADSVQDRLRFDSAFSANAALSVAPSQSCSGP